MQPTARQGNDAMTTEKYDIAITQFESALRNSGDPTAQAKLDEAKRKSRQRESRCGCQSVAAKLEQAKIAYTGKNMKRLLPCIKNVLQLNQPILRSGQIALIEQELNKQKEQADQYKLN
ncbi:MAG: hypothetical protein IPM74_19770 [Crocinitomicaceae bacterium]|nr:hypothetical protein [Crocinitomicaceae bacterium]